MGLFFKYGIKKLPVAKEGQVRGSVNKSALTSQLRKTDHFGRNVVSLIEKLMEPADRNLLSRLRQKLEREEITGIPVISFSGELQRVITPGILQTEKESGKYLDEATQRALFEKLLRFFPFPIELLANGSQIFTNEIFSEKEDSVCEWTSLELEEERYTIKVYFPAVVFAMNNSLKSLREGEDIKLRELLEEVENILLDSAQANSDSTSRAAELVNLPRQTFDYRRKKNQEKG